MSFIIGILILVFIVEVLFSLTKEPEIISESEEVQDKPVTISYGE